MPCRIVVACLCAARAVIVRVGPDGKKIAERCLPSDAVRLKVPLSKLSFIKPVVSIRLIFQEWLVKIRRDEGMRNVFTGVSNIFHNGIIREWRKIVQ